MRDSLVAELSMNWAHAEAPIFYENTTEIDLAALGDYFMHCQIEFDGSVQADISATPFDRTHGELVLTVFGRVTLGTRQVLVYLEELKSLFRFKTLSGVHMQAASPGQSVSQDGWFSMELRTPFFADSNT